MTARLYLDDPYQRYKPNEIAFLKQLANTLPHDVHLRSSHDADGRLLYVFQVNVAQRYDFIGDLPADRMATLVAQARHELALNSKKIAGSLQLEGGRTVVNTRTHCRKCGDVLLPRPGAKRRHETICPTCDDGNPEDIVAQEAINRHKLRVRRAI